GDSRERVRAHATLSVCLHLNNAFAAEPKHGERLEGADVDFFADDYGDGRRAEEPLCLDGPINLCEDGMTRRGERGEVGRGGAGDESADCAERQTEKLDEPFQGHCFDGRGGGRKGFESRALIPGTGKPIRGDGDWKRASRDKAEVARASGGDGCGRAYLIEEREDIGGIGWICGKRRVPCCEVGEIFGRWENATLFDCFQVMEGAA